MSLWKKFVGQYILPKATPVVKKPATPKPVVSKPESVSPPPKLQPDIPKMKKPAEKINKIDYRKEFLRTFHEFDYRYNPWDVWRDFIVMVACSFSNVIDKNHYEIREKRYLSIIKRYGKEDQNRFPKLLADLVMAMEEDPEQDFLGKIFMELNLGNQHKGQFFTPYHVCQLMADAALGDAAEHVRSNGYVTIGDFCCGAGATLIAGIHTIRKQLEKENLNYQNHVLVVGQDVDETVALMCYIQLYLLGVAAYIKVGNTFTDPIAEGDSLDNYWFTLMYFSDVWSTRRLIQKVNDLLEGDEKK